MTSPLRLYRPRKPSAAAIQVLAWAQGESDTLARLIEQDAALMLSVLRQVNATAADQRQSVGTLQDAMHDLGQQAVHQLASLGVILAALEDLPLDRQRTLHVLGQSVQVASAAAEILGDTAEGRWAFTAGLMQDLGGLVLQANGSQGALPMVGLQGSALCWAEAKLHGQDHTQRGSQLAQDWGLPEQIVLAVAGHHDTEPGPRAGPVQETLRGLNLQASQPRVVHAPPLHDMLRPTPLGARLSSPDRRTLALSRMAAG